MVEYIGIGIDTGGTYTDAVAYDFASKRILAKAKALTTRHDLSIGILEAFDRLAAGKEPSPKIIALSTTLATNACVENKMGRAKLIFFGGDRKLIDAYGGDRKLIDAYGGDCGLPPAAEMLLPPCHATYSRGGVDDVDWETFRREVVPALRDLDGVGIIETYSMRNSAAIENRAREIVAETAAIPAVCGHELVSELASLRRGASTLLNASLFPVIDAFVRAIKISMARRNVVAPVLIVRSDGNLMSETFAALRPVETLLCGPAASVMGCVELTGEKDCVVVDMGGTTTDIALVRDGKPVKAESGIGAGKWKTFIKGLSIRTVGLGGDSAVRYHDGGITLESRRAVPLCVAAAQHPRVKQQLEELLANQGKHTRHLHEFLMLVKNIGDSDHHTETERRLCAALKTGPLILRQAAAAVGGDEYTFDATRLIDEGVVHRCGLTPTDIMHLRGDFSAYDAEASALGARFVADNLNVTVEELCELVYTEVRRKLYANVVKALMENDNPEYRRSGFPEGVDVLIDESFRRLQNGEKALLNIGFATELTLVGIGAPIHVFLPEVAAMLGARAVIPRHAEVANALGAVVGRIHADSKWEIRPDYNTEGIAGYLVYGSEETAAFKEREEAERFAIAGARREACEEARRRGASGEIAVHCETRDHDGETKNGPIYLGTKVTAHAVGSESL